MRILLWVPRLSIRLLSVALPVLLLVGVCEANDSSTPEYVYWTGAATPGRLDYELAVVDAALKRSVAAYGPYHLTLDQREMPSVRGRMALIKGDDIHFVATTRQDYDPRQLIVVRHPIEGGLLGYRQLLIKAERLPEFANITRPQQLQKLIAGQGRGWPDVDVYRANHFNVEEILTFEQLLPVLLSERIDYIPLGIDEIEPTLTRYGDKYPGMTKVPGLMIYYPMPVFLVVSARHPTLAARLNAGLKMMTEDGSLQRLFMRYKGDTVATIKATNPTLIMLRNPNLPPAYNLPPALLARPEE